MRAIGPQERNMPLTKRQLRVMTLVSYGLTLDKIADRLGISRTTVEDHLKISYAKLGARERAHAVRLCFEQGYFLVKTAPVDECSPTC